MYGREYMGVDRSTFIVDEKGKIKSEWRGVKVTGHVKEVLQAVKELVK
jgi:thioredoxin-dependent peroxiredoxin